MNVFEFTEYKAALGKMANSAEAGRGYKSRLAQAMGCQKSYLSQVFHTKTHLTQDQALAACLFWQFNSRETEYFLLLVDQARAASPLLQKHIQKRLHQLKRESENLALRFQQPGIESELHKMTYYSAWYYSAIHILISIPKFQSPDSISKKLNLSAELVKSALKTLEAMDLAVRIEPRRWKATTTSIHLSQDSPLVHPHHANWRQQALASIQLRDPRSLHYSSICSLRRDDVVKLKKQVVEFVARSRSFAQASSPEEDLVCLNLDYFVLG